MVTQPLPPAPFTHNSKKSFIYRLMMSIIGGSVLALIAGILITIGFEFVYLGRIYPGTYAAGVDLSGLTKNNAEILLEEKIQFPESGIIVLGYKDRLWAYTPYELGLSIDIEETVTNAYSVGRTGWPWKRLIDQLSTLQRGVYLSPQLRFDARSAQIQLGEIARQINQSTIEAKLSIDGLDVIIEPGQVGIVVDIPETIKTLEKTFIHLQDNQIELSIIEFPPAILDVTAQANLAKGILSQPLTLNIQNSIQDDLGPWTLDQKTLASMLTIELVTNNDEASYRVGLDSNKLRSFLISLTTSLILEPADARFIFNDETRELDVIQNAIIGRRLLVEETINHINDELSKGSHAIGLVFDLTNPEITDDLTGEDLGITELVSSQTTYFYGSTQSRIQNIQTAAAQFHGILIPPGATFSMVDNIGDISLETGYAEALIIYGNRTIKGVGGGVCQVSTTLFRTVFFGGFPIEERYSHAYRVLYYEQTKSGAADTRLAGLDATVYTPLVDFKFTNDTPYWLLMETYVNPSSRSLTWKFYSTSDNREVEWTTSGLTNKQDPPDPVYEEDPDLGLGAIVQVDWAVEGASVTVTRTVIKDNEILHYDEFKTNYRPWASVCKYGSGTKNLPPDEDKTLDKYDCKANK